MNDQNAKILLDEDRYPDGENSPTKQRKDPVELRFYTVNPVLLCVKKT